MSDSPELGDHEQEKNFGGNQLDRSQGHPEQVSGFNFAALTNPEIPSLKDAVSDEEWQVRVDLAATYRLVAHHGWDDMIYTHISARVPGTDDHFLINPYGLLFDEITASSLIKVDTEGKVLQDTNFSVNAAGFTIHSAVHMARHDAGCVIHLHTDDGVAVAAQKDGLLPLSQHAMMLMGQVAYHDYEGIALDLDERERVVADLGEKHLMILRNHGTLSCGASCADAFMGMFFLERACTMQIKALSGGGTWTQPHQGVPEKTSDQGKVLFNGSAGKLAWPALLRKMDKVDPSFRD